MMPMPAPKSTCTKPTQPQPINEFPTEKSFMDSDALWVKTFVQTVRLQVPHDFGQVLHARFGNLIAAVVIIRVRARLLRARGALRRLDGGGRPRQSC